MAGTYNLITEYSDDENADDIATSPHWVVAVVRLDKPLSYSRKDKKSVSTDSSEGAKTRGKTLIITSDALSLNISGSKEQHVKSLNVTLAQTHTNYLVEILPGDWVMAWILHGSDRQRDLIDRIKTGNRCNKFDDGLKFIGRVESIRKKMSRDPGSGQKHSRYMLQAYGFRELDTQIFYDQFLASKSVEAQNIGRWLAKIGLNFNDLFAIEANGQKDNVHLLISKILETIVGNGAAGLNDTQEPELRQTSGGGTVVGDDGKTEEAPFAYLVPKEIGDLLGKESRDASKAGGILAYADIIELLFGVQKYSNTSPNEYKLFIPDIADGDKLTKGNHKYTGIPLMGAFLPLMPSFANQPLWSVLQQYLNPVINEMYTCLRVNSEGNVVPTVVLRQIPFTTDVLADKWDPSISSDEAGPLQEGQVRVDITPFSTLPRWLLPGVMVHEVDIGRSDASRCNFVHVYGQNADVATNTPITDQIVKNPPIRDDLDIQRSGLHTFMTTVACRQINQVGTTPGVWMELIADHRIGSQYTLNGTIHCVGIQAPICEGDNLEFDGVLYHIESLAHACALDSSTGNRSWHTTLTLTNGVLARDGFDDVGEFPIYPGFRKDGTGSGGAGGSGDAGLDPGISVDDDKLDNEDPGEEPEVPSGLDPEYGPEESSGISKADLITADTSDFGVRVE